MYIRNPGHMTKMAAMPIYGKKPSKVFSRTSGPISTKLGMKHRWLKHYNVYINHDPVMTLTYFTAMSILETLAFTCRSVSPFNGTFTQHSGMP